MKFINFKILFYIFCILVLFFIALPIFIVIPISFSSASYLQFPPPEYSLKWYQEIWNDPSYISSIINSFQVAILTVFFSLILAIPASYALVRSSSKSKGFFTSIIISPMIVSHIIISISIYKMYAEMHLIGNIFGMAIAHTIIVMPFLVLNITSILRGVDINIERAAQVLGANKFILFKDIIFPLIKPGVLAGGLLSFIISFDELVLAMFICGTKRTLPVRIWEDIRLELTPSLAAISTLLIAFSILIFIFSLYLQKKFRQ